MILLISDEPFRLKKKKKKEKKLSLPFVSEDSSVLQSRMKKEVPQAGYSR